MWRASASNSHLRDKILLVKFGASGILTIRGFFRRFIAIKWIFRWGGNRFPVSFYSCSLHMLYNLQTCSIYTTERMYIWILGIVPHTHTLKYSGWFHLNSFSKRFANICRYLLVKRQLQYLSIHVCGHMQSHSKYSAVTCNAKLLSTYFAQKTIQPYFEWELGTVFVHYYQFA